MTRFFNNKGKRGLALFLALLMCVNLLSLTAFASGEELLAGWEQDEQTVKGDDAVCVVEGGLCLKAGSSNGNGHGATDDGWPAIFVNDAINAKLYEGVATDATKFVELTFTPTAGETETRFGVYINYTNPGRGFIVGYDGNGGWYWEEYGGTNSTYYMGTRVHGPDAGSETTLRLEWKDNALTKATANGTDLFPDMPRDFSTTADNSGEQLGIKCGTYGSQITEVTISSIDAGVVGGGEGPNPPAEKPAAPTNEQISAAGIFGVDVWCGNDGTYNKDHWLSISGYNIGEVTANEDSDKAAYPYMCEVRSSHTVEELVATFNAHTDTTKGSFQGHVRDTERGPEDPVATLYYNVNTSTWELLTNDGRNSSLRPYGNQYFLTIWVDRYATYTWETAEGTRTQKVSLCKAVQDTVDTPAAYTKDGKTYTFKGWTESTDELGNPTYTARYDVTEPVNPPTPPESEYDGECGAEAGTVFYKLNGTELHIWGNGAMATFGSWSNTSPWYGDKAGVTSVVIDEGVTSIGGYAFMNCTSLNNVTIPESVTSIEYYAFYGTGLASVTIPNGVTSIGFSAFKDCSSLASVSLPDSLTELGSSAFARTALTSVAIPEGVTEIKDELFWNCKQLTSVTFPNGLTTIGKEAFRGTALGAVTLPDTVSTIKENAFYESGLTSINIPTGVTKIDTGVFHCCKNLTQIELPEGVTEIGYLAFRETGLTSIVIPANVTAIGEYAFLYCKQLHSVVFEGNPTVHSGAFSTESGLTRIHYCAADGATTDANAYNAILDGGTIPAGTVFQQGKLVTPVKEGYTFQGWFNGETALEKEGDYCVIPADTVKGAVFTAKWTEAVQGPDLPTEEQVAELLKVRIGGEGNAVMICVHNKVYTLTAADYTLGNVQEFNTVYPYTCELKLTKDCQWWIDRFNDETDIQFEHVLASDTSGFVTTGGVAKLYYSEAEQKWVLPPQGSSISTPGVSIERNGNFMYLYVWYGYEYKWLDHDGNQVYRVYKGACSNGNHTAPSATSCTQTLPGYVENGTYYAFAGWQTPAVDDETRGVRVRVYHAKYEEVQGLVINDNGSVTIPGGTKMGKMTIPEAVVSVTVPSVESLANLNVDTRYYYLDLPEGASVLLRDGTPVTGESRLYCCSYNGTHEVMIPSTGYLLVSGSGKLEKAKNCVRTMYKGSITEVKVHGNVTDTGAVCENLSKLTKITLPEGVTTIGDSAFRYCESLTSFTIPETVTSIGDGAFYGAGLSTVVVPNSVTSIGSSAFSNCNNLKTVVLPASAALGNQALASKPLSTLVLKGAPGTLASNPSYLFGFSQRAKLTVYVNDPADITSDLQTALDARDSYYTYNIANLNGGEIAEFSDTGFATLAEREGLTFQGWFDAEGNLATAPTGKKVTYTAKWEESRTVIEISATVSGDKTVVEADENGMITIPGGYTLWVGGQQIATVPKGVTSVKVPEASVSELAVKEIRLIGQEMTLPTGSSALLPDGTPTEELKLLCYKSGSAYEVLAPESGLFVVSGMDMGTYTEKSKIPWRSNLSSIKTVKIMDGVTSICNHAFSGCTNLESVDIPDSVKTIGASAFATCSKLTSVRLPVDLTEVKERAFSGCAGLTSIDLSGKISKIGAWAFEYCKGLTSVVVPDNVKSIGNNAFYGCDKLQSIILPDGIRLEGDRIFSRCNALRVVVFEGTPKMIASSLFGGSYDMGTRDHTKDLTVYVTSAEAILDGLTSSLDLNPKSTYNIAILNGGEIAELKLDGFATLAEREGLTFLGWFDEDGNKVETPAYDKKTYTAKWEETKVEYTVTIDGKDYIVEEGSSLKDLLDTITPTTDEEGVHFDKWVDGNGNEIAEDAVVEGNMTITATWAKDEYTVTIDGTEHTVKHGDKLSTVLPENPTRGGYTFQGWFNGEDEVTADTVITGGMTVTSKWAAIPTTVTSYTLTINYVDESGNTVAPTHTRRLTSGSSYNVTSPAVEGMTPDQTAVTGRLTRNTTVTVTYTADTNINEPDVPLAELPLPFEDVKDGDWYRESVAYVWSNGLMLGTDDKVFGVNTNTTRGMMATMLYRLEKEPATTFKSVFDDVENGKWFSLAVTWANANSVVLGYGNGNFGPEDDVTREQLVTMLYRYSSMKGFDVSKRADLGKFADAGKVSAYAKDAMSWAVAEGLVLGRSADSLAPNATALRVEVAALFQRFTARYMSTETIA